MADDVIVCGDLIEYRNAQRCEACQSRVRDCIMKKGAETCVLCSDNGRPCIFERVVRLRGPSTQLPSDLMLARKTLIDLDQDVDVINPRSVLKLASMLAYFSTMMLT